MQSAWVIEDGLSSPSAPLYSTCKPGITWSYLHEEALRFARKVDAEAYVARYHPVKNDGTSKPHRVCEHQWG